MKVAEKRERLEMGHSSYGGKREAGGTERVSEMPLYCMILVSLRFVAAEAIGQRASAQCHSSLSAN